MLVRLLPIVLVATLVTGCQDEPEAKYPVDRARSAGTSSGTGDRWSPGRLHWARIGGFSSTHQYRGWSCVGRKVPGVPRRAPEALEEESAT